MKRLFFIALVATTFAFKIEIRKADPNYIIGESKSDHTIGRNQSRFTFTFFDDSGKPISKKIKMSYNDTNNDLETDKCGKDSIILMPGKYVFKFFYSEEFYEITTDSIEILPMYGTEIQVHFQSSRENVICRKPVIYVYPTKIQSVNIKLRLEDSLTYTYPTYNSGWNFIADPNGTIHMNNNKEYNYLFWEGKTQFNINKINWEEGYNVPLDSLTDFFEKQLLLMGFNSKETADYITYWCPLMMQTDGEHLHIHFLFNDEFGQYAPLTISPKPDQLFRVFMLWSKAEPENDLKPQIIPSFNRNGFTVLEWGGSEMEYMQSSNLFSE